MSPAILLLSLPEAQAVPDLKTALSNLAGEGLEWLPYHGPPRQIACKFPGAVTATKAASHLRERFPSLAAAIHIHQHREQPDQPSVSFAEHVLLLTREGQILLSELAAAEVRPEIPLSDLGYHRMRDLLHAVRLFSVGAPPAEPLRSLDTLPNNLPVQLTSFVGRDRELSDVALQLQASRLVTIMGPGGVGKTRLALQAAASVVDRYEDGAWFIPLEAVQSPEAIVQAMASSIGLLGEVRDSQADSLLAALKRACADRRILLLLDNCEHLVEQCALLARELLAACPGLSMLCTSREPLGIGGEVLHELAPLPTPACRDGDAPEQLLSYSALQLFQERAAAIQPGFALTRENAPAIAEICTRLDGIPLAIELAAARIRVLAPAELAARLKDRFGLLTSGSRLARPRHQTLRAAVEWSYQLLSEQERTLWRRLSVFAGGFTLEAAEAIVPGGALEKGDILTLLALLADKSILRVDRSGENLRYSMLETIREYGRERLAEAGEEAMVHRRHTNWFSDWVRGAHDDILGSLRLVWFARLEQEIGNLRAALAWALTDEESAAAGLSLAWTLSYFWMRGRMREGLKWLSSLLALPALQGASRVRVAALSAAGVMALTSGLEEARRYLEEGLAGAQALGSKVQEGIFVNNLGQLILQDGRPAEALELFSRGMVIHRSAGREDYALISLNNIAYAHIHLGNLTAAGNVIDEAVAAWRKQNHPFWFCCALERAGLHRVMVGRLDEARDLLSEALTVAARLEDPDLTSHCAERIAGWLLAKGRPEPAAQLLGAAAAVRTRYDLPFPGWDEPLLSRLKESVQARLGPSAFGLRFAEGESWPMADIWTKAQELLDASEQAPAPLPGGLTARELEVAELVAQGLPDREVAARLYLSRFTINNHLRNIYGKLGISSRAALVTWAFQNGLAKSDSASEL